MNSLLLFVAFTVILVVANSIVLRDAARICELPKHSWLRAFAISGTRFAAALLIGVMWLLACDKLGLVGVLVVMATDMAITYALICRVLGGRGRAASRTFVLQIGIGIVTGIGGLFIWSQFTAAYTLTTSSMSPNLRGYHTMEVLDNGNHLIIAANDPRDPLQIPAGSRSGGIVAETHEYRNRPRPAKYTHVADRIICNKTKSPNRWDAVAFRYPRDTSVIYVKRIVGMPGERLAIESGDVWINDEKLSPPERLGPIRYATQQEIVFIEGKSYQVTLGPDEFCVLGDNPNASMDSREWGPLKKDLIVGVVDAIYWPPSRWRVNP